MGGGFSDGSYGYLAPNLNGEVARFRLDVFNQVQVLDLTATDADLNGFQQGFSDGSYGYLAPNHNGARFGKVAQFSRGVVSQVQVLDFTTTKPTLKGFMGASALGHGYLAPNINGAHLARWHSSGPLNQGCQATWCFLLRSACARLMLFA